MVVSRSRSFQGHPRSTLSHVVGCGPSADFQTPLASNWQHTDKTATRPVGFASGKKPDRSITTSHSTSVTWITLVQITKRYQIKHQSPGYPRYNQRLPSGNFSKIFIGYTRGRLVTDVDFGKLWSMILWTILRGVAWLSWLDRWLSFMGSWVRIRLWSFLQCSQKDGGRITEQRHRPANRFQLIRNCTWGSSTVPTIA